MMTSVAPVTKTRATELNERGLKSRLEKKNCCYEYCYEISVRSSRCFYDASLAGLASRNSPKREVKIMQVKENKIEHIYF